VRLVHLSDLHLGYRQYQRLTPTGINQREADVAAAFRVAIDRIIDLAPDIVLFGGDVFHTVRPTNPAILHAFQQLSRLTRELPRALVVMIAGNHDTPRAVETGCILRLFRPLGVHAIDSAADRIEFRDHDLAVLAVPDIVGALPALRPDPAFRYNILLMHCELEGIMPSQHVLERATMVMSPRELHAPDWSYVALGHYHVFREIEPNTFYSGSIEYTSTNVWGELVEEREHGVPGKGFIEFDLETGRHTFHHVEPARRFVDLPAFSARGLSAPELDARIAEVVERAGERLDDSVARLVIRDVPRHIARALDHHALRALKRRALHFHLDLRRPDVLRVHGSGAPGRRPSLADVVREKLSAREVASDVDRPALVALGLSYLQEADAIAATAAVPDLDGTSA
jgi:DNA repair protein SbcD/Mre11